VAHFVWENGHLAFFPYKKVPPQRLLHTLTVVRRIRPQPTSVDICEGEGGATAATGAFQGLPLKRAGVDGASAAPSIFPARPAVSLRWW
jgi:hypothetical protein